MRHRIKQWFTGLLSAVVILSMLPAALAEDAAQPDENIPAAQGEEAPPSGLEETPAGEAPSTEDGDPLNEGSPAGEPPKNEAEASPAPDEGEAPGAEESVQQAQTPIDALPDAESNPPENHAGDDGSGWPEGKIHIGYDVTVQPAANGTASAAPTYASEGTQIVLTAVPDAGYHLKEWQTEPEVTVTGNSFTMPASDVTVTPVFEAHAFDDEWSSDGSTHWHGCVCGEKRDESAHAYTGGVCSACGHSFDCNIFVKTVPDGKHITIHINSTDTVRSVKEKIEEVKGIPASVQVLTFDRVELKDDQYLGDCGVQKDSTLHLALQYAPGGAGTADDPYLISDKETMEAFRYYINEMFNDGGAGKYFQLTESIDLGGSADDQWTPIGDGSSPFQGVFDGGGFTVSGLYIDQPGSPQMGLFGMLGNGGTVKNLHVQGTVIGSSNVAGIVGENSGVVENCFNEGSISGGDATGGIVGMNMNGTVENCYNTAAVTGDGMTGGVVGSNSGAVTNCYYLDTCGAAGEGTAKTAGQFASGEVAYLLQKEQEPQVWGQSLGGDAPDEYPTLTGEGAKRVYQITFLAERMPGYEARLYANPGGTGVLAPEMPRVEGYAPVKWSLKRDAGGAAFTGSTAVDGDMTVYAVYEKCGSLTVSVSAAGEGADPDRAWRFRVEVDDPYYEGSGELSFTDGAAEFTLKAGQSLTLADLTPGMRYTVAELNGNSDGYATTVTGGEGTIASGEEAVAAFLNEKTATTPEAPEEPGPSSGPERPEIPENTNTPADKPLSGDANDQQSGAPGDVPDTGDESRLSLWLSVLIFSLMGIAALALTSAIGKKNPSGTTGRYGRK